MPPGEAELRERGVREGVIALASARDAQPMADIVGRLVARERRESPAHADALAELAQLGRFEHRIQLRLPEQQDLDQLVPLGLQIGEQPDLLERLGRPRLSTIRSTRLPANAPSRKWFSASTSSRADWPPLTPSSTRIDSSSSRGQLGIEQERDFDLAACASQQRAAQRRLPVPTRPDRDEAPALPMP
jgi:hypothetical protein